MNMLMNKISPSITDMIRMDHTHVLTTFHQYNVDSSPRTRAALVASACLALEIHAQLEEEIFYPAMREASTDAEVLQKSVPEHDEMRTLIATLRTMSPEASGYSDTFMALMRDVMHHVADEETTLLPDAERLLGPERLRELGARMTKRRFELAAPRAGEIAKNTVSAMPASYLIGAAGALLAGTYLVRRVMSSSRMDISRLSNRA